MLQELLQLDASELNGQISYLLGSSTKIEKTWKKLRVGTRIQYLSPANESGLWNLCPWASHGCASACLKSSGRMVYSTAERARVKRTVLFMKHREIYLARLRRELENLATYCDHKGVLPSARLNGTSDVAWESVAPELFRDFRDVQFYDYTKSEARARAFKRVYPLSIHNRPDPRDDWPRNYHLTFSRDEETRDETILQLASMGVNTAVVFDKLPQRFLGLTVIDGDEHDFRPHDPEGVIVGLTQKGGPGKRDRTGFVVRAGDTRCET